MIEWTDELKKQFSRSIYFAFVMFVGAPLIYLFMTTETIFQEFSTSGQNDIMFYILLIIALFYPLVIPILEKAFVTAHHKRNDVKNKSKWAMKLQSHSNKRNSTPEKLYFTFFVVKSALVEASFIFGLLIYIVSGDMTRMLYFYVVGIAWSLVVFPTKSRCEKFLEKVSANAIV